MQSICRKLSQKSSEYITYNIVSGKEPYIIFLSGLKSDRNGTKALAFEKFAKKHGYGFIRFDYYGHGDSSRKFVECTIDTWRDNLLDVIDKLTSGKVVLVGSSLGGWIMMLAALERPSRVKALLGIAAAPDFTEDLIWRDLSDAAKRQLERGEVYNLPSNYCDGEYEITMNLIESGRRNLILAGTSKLDIECPVRLFQGMKDEDVPYEYAEKIKQKLKTKDVKVTYLPDGDHRLSDIKTLNLICETLQNLVDA